MLAFNRSSAELTQIGHYDLLGKVGKGGSGTVYRAVDRTSGQVVAVKVMPADLARNPVLRKRFEEEFLTARQLDHPILDALAGNATAKWAIEEGHTAVHPIDPDRREPSTDVLLLLQRGYVDVGFMGGAQIDQPFFARRTPRRGGLFE